MNLKLRKFSVLCSIETRYYISDKPNMQCFRNLYRNFQYTFLTLNQVPCEKTLLVQLTVVKKDEYHKKCFYSSKIFSKDNCIDNALHTCTSISIWTTFSNGSRVCVPGGKRPECGWAEQDIFVPHQSFGFRQELRIMKI